MENWKLFIQDLFPQGFYLLTLILRGTHSPWALSEYVSLNGNMSHREIPGGPDLFGLSNLHGYSN